MVHSGCRAVGMVTSLLRRCYNRRRGYELIPRCEAMEEEKGESRKAQNELCKEEEEGCKAVKVTTVSWKNEVREGESQEACGDRLLAQFRSHPGTSFAAYKDLHHAAYFYTHAGSWRKAALAYGELAACCHKTGRVMGAGSALLRSAKCYAEIEDKTLEEVVATKLALDEALALFVDYDDLWLAASACSELGEFHMEHNELHSALVFYRRAAGYHGTKNPLSTRYYTSKADYVKFLLDNQEALRAQGDLPLDDFKRKSTRYMKPTDHDWAERVGRLLSSTSIAHDPASFLRQHGLEHLCHGAIASSRS